jgi:hypothetical protein
MSNLLKDSSVYTLETPDEKKMRMFLTAIAVIAFLGIGLFFLPKITQIIHNWIDFGIALVELFVIVAVIGTLIVMRNILFNLWKAMVKRLTRWFIKSNLPDLLEVVVANRRAVLAKFNDRRT